MKLSKKFWLRLAAVPVIVLALLWGALFVYTLDYSRPTEAAVAALIDTAEVDVEQDSNMLLFTPRDVKADIGFAFYPGGKVDFRAYAPLMAELAERGIACVLLKVPFQLAVFDINAADRAFHALPDITRWYVGGHSLGGAMASSFASSNADKLEGVVFLAAYPAGDIKNSGLRVLSLYGSNDGVLNIDNYESGKSQAPADAAYLVITGGNHAGFGSYGVQKGDNPASITAQEQVARAADAILLFMEESDPSAAVS